MSVARILRRQSKKLGRAIDAGALGPLLSNVYPVVEHLREFRGV
jgi:hypothetical protein